MASSYSSPPMFFIRFAPLSAFEYSGITSSADRLTTSKKNFLLSVYSLNGLPAVLIETMLQI